MRGLLNAKERVISFPFLWNLCLTKIQGFLLSLLDKWVARFIREDRHFQLLLSSVRPVEFREAFQDQWFWIVWLVSWDFSHLGGCFWRAWARLCVLSWNQILISFLVKNPALCTSSDIFYSLTGFLRISYLYFTGDSWPGKGASFLFQWCVEKEKSQIELIYLFFLDAFFS